MRFLAVTFAVAVMIRLTPELLSYPTPIGFDTVAYYAPSLAFFPGGIGALFLIPFLSPVFYLLVKPLTIFLNAFDALRVASCILYGLLASSIYVFCRRRLMWSPSLSALASIFIVSYFVTLRIGWDLFKNELGIILIMLTFSYFPKKEVTKNDFIALSLASTLLSLTHQLSYLFFLLVLGFVSIPLYILPWQGWKRCRATAWVLPSVLVFLSSYIAFDLPPQFPSAQGVAVTFLPLGYSPDSISPFVNYLAMYQGSYGALTFDVLSLLAFLYLPIIPFAVVGRFRERITFAWTAVALAASLQVLLTPSFGFWLWDRWMLLLFFPLLLYAIRGIWRIVNKIQPKAAKGLILLLIVGPFAILNLGFMTRPPDNAFFYFANPAIWPHFPSSMLSNTLPLQDAEDAMNVLRALNMQLNSSTVLLVHEAFYGWAVLTISQRTNIIGYNRGSPSDAVPLALQRGFKIIYTIWWTKGYGWYGQQIPDDFKVTITHGRIAAYIYTGNLEASQSLLGAS